MQPQTFPRTTITGANYDASTPRPSTALSASGYDDLRAEQAARRPPAGQQADRHRRVVIRRGHRTGRAARRMGRMRGQRRRLCDRVRRHECPRPRALDRIRDARQRRARHTDGQDHTRQLRHFASAQVRHARLAVAADRRQRDPRRAEGVLERAKKIAAHMLRRHPDDVVVGDGGLQVAGVPANAVSWAELAAASRDAAKLLDDVEPGPLRHELDFDGTDSTFPFGTLHLRGRGRHGNGWRHDAAAHRRRRLWSHPQPVAGSVASSTAASGRARRRRCTST